MKFSRNIYDTLFQSFKPYRFQIVLLLLVGLSSRLIFLSNAKVIANAVDSTNEISRNFLISLSLKVFAILIVSLLLTLIYRVLFSRLCSYAISHIYDETTYRASRFPLSFFDQTPVGKISTRFSSDYGNAFRLFGGPLAEFISIIFDLVSIITIMIWINPSFGFPLLLSGLLYYFILKLNQKKLRENRSALSLQRAPSIAHFSETVQGALCIRQDQRQNSFANHFQELDNLYTRIKIIVSKNIFSFSFQLSVMSLLLILMNAFICMHFYRNHQMDAGEITVIISYTLLATTALQMFFEWYSQFDEALIGVQRLDEYLRSPIEPGSLLPTQTKFNTGQPVALTELQPPPKAERLDLVIKNLSLRYQNQPHDTLKNLNLTITAGQKVGLIGRTGSGKTSLISAILKLYPFSSGEIEISGLTPVSVDEYRQRFAVISQDAFFIKGSLRDNLDFTGKHSDETLRRALNRIQIKIDLDYPIEEKGSNLSQGEKQLISMARGLLKNASIIIFDEATANIDPKSEALVNEVLRKSLKDRTQIIIAHRLDSVRDCDVIVWLSEGSIKKIGPPKEILEAFITTG